MVRKRTRSPQPALLGLLMSGPKHGYDLHQEFSQELGKVWHLGRSNLYAQIKGLEAAGWVTKEAIAQENRPPRKVYRLTPAGEAQFLEWLRQPTPHLRHIRIEFLTRLYFFQRLSLPGLEELVAHQKAMLKSQVESITKAAEGEKTRFGQLVLDYRRGQMEAAIAWLDRCLQA